MCIVYCTAAEKEDLGISSYGISVTTMEEVFMKVREGTDESLKHRSPCVMYYMW